MTYRIEIEKKPLKFIEKQPKDKRESIFMAIAKLPAGDIKSLRGRSDLYRLRVGTYRIVYRIDNGMYVICVVDAGNRGQIYNRI